MSEIKKLYIDNEWVTSKSQRFEEVTDPSTNEVLATVPLCTKEEMDLAVERAKAAFPSWKNTPAPKRAAVMFKLQNILLREQVELAKIISLEHGKVLDDAKGAVRRAIDMVEFACGIPSLIKGETVPNVSNDVDCATWRAPLGVCAAVTPFNFPIMVPMWFAPIAIACGNTFILKASEKTPLTAFKLAECFEEAGLPKGVFNVLVGDKECVDVLLEHPDVKAISFVGSTPVGKAIYKNASANGKRVQSLTGAKNHLVVMPDADIDKTVEALVGSVYGSAGERCMAISVCVMVGKIADVLIPKLIEKSKQLKVGKGIDPGAQMGPLVTKDHMAKVLSYIDQGVKEGADMLLDGREIKVEDYPNGNWVGPTIFDHVKTDMTIYKEEIFGPVLSIVRAESLTEAIEIIDGHPAGNGTSIFTDSGLAARTFREQVNVGMIGVNVPIPVPMAFFPFTGWKDSFFGTLRAHGPDGVNFYTDQKVVTTKWLGANKESLLNMSI